MQLWELFVIAVGLSMDAFAVSICKGLACREQNLRHNLLAGLYFGGFQGLMPAIGWLLGSTVGVVSIVTGFFLGPIIAAIAKKFRPWFA